MRTQSLLAALARNLQARPQDEVLVRRAGRPDQRISLHHAAQLAQDPDWLGSGSSRRVKMLHYDPQPVENPWMPCWANTEASVLRFA